MTVSEIFSKINNHMIEGMMLHEQMANYYDFLGLDGFKRMHEYHFLKEAAQMRGINRYYINHYNMLVHDASTKNPEAVPMAWHKYARQDVDASTKRNAVKTACEKWHAWEKETKKLYQESYMQLCDLGEIAAACKIKELVKAVDMELKGVERLHIKLKSIDYDLPTIILMQDDMHDKYKSKKIKIDMC